MNIKTKLQIGMIGLGRMGGNLTRQALQKKIQVIGFTTEGAPKDLIRSGCLEIKKISSFILHLKKPRKIFIYVPAGPEVDKVINELSIYLEPNDIILDGGNSYWQDSITRANHLKNKKIKFIDLGTSGGINGALNGACFMAGGDPHAFKIVEPILKKLAVPNGYVYTGPSGTGHFTKLVHNGIEFGMIQAIGEGIDLLEQFPQKLPIEKILTCYQNGSVIRSWLIDLMKEMYSKEGGLNKIPSYVDDTGEVNWLLEDAIKMEVSIPIISQSIMQLFSSRDKKKNWAKAIAMMRKGFGQHAYGPSQPAQIERKIGKVGKY